MDKRDMPDTARGKRLEAYALIALAHLDLAKAYQMLNAADEQEAGR